MNKFTYDENCNAQSLAKAAKLLAAMYAHPQDLQAATVALLLAALELAGGKHFAKPQENEE